MTTDETVAVSALDDRLGEAGAARVLQPRWRAWLPRGAGPEHRLELVRLPVAIRPAGPAQRDGGAHLYVVERVLGHGWRVAIPGGSRDDGAASAQRSELAGTWLTARLELDACEPRLLALLLRDVLALRLERSSRLPPVGPALAAGYPIWVGYRRDHRGRIRFTAADGVTGARARAPVRAAIAAALIDAAGAAQESSHR